MHVFVWCYVVKMNSRLSLKLTMTQDIFGKLDNQQPPHFFLLSFSSQFFRDPRRGGLLGVKTPFFLAMKIRAPLEGPFRGLFGTGPTFTVRGPENELGAPKVQKRATLRPPSAW